MLDILPGAPSQVSKLEVGEIDKPLSVSQASPFIPFSSQGSATVVQALEGVSAPTAKIITGVTRNKSVWVSISMQCKQNLAWTSLSFQQRPKVYIPAKSEKGWTLFSLKWPFTYTRLFTLTAVLSQILLKTNRKNLSLEVSGSSDKS